MGENLKRLFEEVLEGGALPLHRAAAETAVVSAANQRKRGRPVEIRDVQIAGIVAARKASLATRNIRHFVGIGLMLVDPWSA